MVISFVLQDIDARQQQESEHKEQLQKFLEGSKRLQQELSLHQDSLAAQQALVTEEQALYLQARFRDPHYCSPSRAVHHRVSESTRSLAFHRNWDNPSVCRTRKQQTSYAVLR